MILNHSSSSLAILQAPLSKASVKKQLSNEIAVTEENKSLIDQNKLRNGLVAGQENINFIGDREIAKSQTMIKSWQGAVV